MPTARPNPGMFSRSLSGFHIETASVKDQKRLKPLFRRLRQNLNDTVEFLVVENLLGASWRALRLR
jgi:hypothetical protein